MSGLFSPFDTLKRKKIRKLLERGKEAFEKKDYQEAFARFSQSAALHSPEGQYRLAICYLGGYGVAFNLQDAFLWLESAAHAEWPEAEYMLALCHMQGVPELQVATGYDIFRSQKLEASDLKVDMAAACFWAKKNAERGLANGQALYAYILAGQVKTQEDLQEVYAWYDKAIAQGSPQGYMGKGLQLLKTAKTPEDFAQIGKLLEFAAKYQMGTAIYTLATLYEIGKCVPPTPDRAVQLYKEAAEMGIRPAQAIYGVALKKGAGIEKNLLQAESWLRKAALRGDADAASVLGDMLAAGEDDLPPNYSEAAKWYEKAVQENKHKGAAYSLAFQYLKGLGVSASVDRAVELFQISADQGYEPAILVLTDLAIQSSQIMPLDRLMDVYLRPRAEQGNATFMFLLAKVLMKDAQINKKPEKEIETREWLRKCSAAEKNNAHAQYWYGRMLIQGVGGEKNLEEGYHWVSTAADKGDIGAQLLWASLLLDGLADGQFRAAEAVQYFNKAAEQGSSSAMFSLGAIYGGGNHFPQDRVKAQEWFRQAAEKGHAKAQLMLGRYFLRGLAGITDISQAYHWLQSAKKAGEKEAEAELDYLAQIYDEVFLKADTLPAGNSGFSISEIEKLQKEMEARAVKQVEVAPGLFLFNGTK